MRHAIGALVGWLVLSAAAVCAHAATVVTPLPQGHFAAAAGGGHVVSVREAAGTGKPLIVERIDPGGRATRLAAIDPPTVEDVFDNVTGIAVTPTTWVVAAQFKFEPNTEGDQHAADHEVGETIVSGPIGGGAPATILRCTLDVALDQEHARPPRWRCRTTASRGHGRCALVQAASASRRSAAGRTSAWPRPALRLA